VAAIADCDESNCCDLRSAGGSDLHSGDMGRVDVSIEAAALALMADPVAAAVAVVAFAETEGEFRRAGDRPTRDGDGGTRILA
jgi:hypothetical protein